LAVNETRETYGRQQVATGHQNYWRYLVKLGEAPLTGRRAEGMRNCPILGSWARRGTGKRRGNGQLKKKSAQEELLEQTSFRKNSIQKAGEHNKQNNTPQKKNGDGGMGGGYPYDLKKGKSKSAL